MINIATHVPINPSNIHDVYCLYFPVWSVSPSVLAGRSRFSSGIRTKSSREQWVRIQCMVCFVQNLYNEQMPKISEHFPRRLITPFNMIILFTFQHRCCASRQRRSSIRCGEVGHIKVTRKRSKQENIHCRQAHWHC